MVVALFFGSAFEILGVAALISLSFFACSSYYDVPLSPLSFEVSQSLLLAFIDDFLI